MISKRKKVAVVYGSSIPIPPMRGGAPAIVIYNQIKDLRNKNYIIKVFSNWENGIDQYNKQKEIFTNVRLRNFDKILNSLAFKIPYKLKKFIFGTSRPEMISYYICLIRNLIIYNPDVIVIHVTYHLVFLLGIIFRLKKIIFYHHGSNMHKVLDEGKWNRLVKYSKNGIIAVSKSAFTGTKNSFKNKPRNSWVIHNGVDTELFYPLEIVERKKIRKSLNIPDDSIIYVYHGRIYHTKGINHVIDSFIKSQNHNSNSYLIIIGSSSRENWADSDYETLIKKKSKSVEDKIIFLGWIENSDLRNYLGISDYGLLISKVEEGISLSMLECMACAVPVIATPMGGTTEVIKHNKNGIIIDEKNIEESLDSVMENINRNVYKYSEMKLSAKNTIEKYHDYKIVRKNFESVLKNIL
tara:strand:- start:7023 stop:8252 length:1230 start_codon:yes stop_codon:yes gene_type:complete